MVMNFRYGGEGGGGGAFRSTVNNVMPGKECTGENKQMGHFVSFALERMHALGIGHYVTFARERMHREE